VARRGVEVRGLAFDALTAAQAILRPSAADRETWRRDRQRHLQRATGALLRMPEERCASPLAIEEGIMGRRTQPPAFDVNPGTPRLRYLRFGLDPTERWLYVSSIVGYIYSDQFLTPAGVRCSALRPRRHSQLRGHRAATRGHSTGRPRHLPGIPCAWQSLEIDSLNASMNRGRREGEFLCHASNRGSRLPPASGRR